MLRADHTPPVATARMPQANGRHRFREPAWMRAIERSCQVSWSGVRVVSRPRDIADPGRPLFVFRSPGEGFATGKRTADGLRVAKEAVFHRRGLDPVARNEARFRAVRSRPPGGRNRLGRPRAIHNAIPWS